MNNTNENWQKLYSLLRKELPKFRGSPQVLNDIVRNYAKQFGILNLSTDQIKSLIKKFV